jgi:hypothetical protein
MSALIHQLYDLLVLPAMSTEQKEVIKNAICSINTAEQVLSELEIADGIIKNCIKNMDSNQQLRVAIENAEDNLSAPWAFRSTERKEVIERGERFFRNNNNG